MKGVSLCSPVRGYREALRYCALFTGKEVGLTKGLKAEKRYTEGNSRCVSDHVVSFPVSPAKVRLLA